MANTLKCPECGGRTEYEGDRKKIYCQYCGAMINLSEEGSVIDRITAEAKLKEQLNRERELRLMDEEIKLRKEKEAYERKKEQEKNSIKGTFKSTIKILFLLILRLALWWIVMKVAMMIITGKIRIF